MSRLNGNTPAASYQRILTIDPDTSDWVIKYDNAGVDTKPPSLDMDTSIRILNLPYPVTDDEPATKAMVDALVASTFPSQSGNAGKYLNTDGTVATWEFPDGSIIIFTPAGNVISTDVQAAIEELDAEKAKLAGDVAQGFSVDSLIVGGAVDGRDVAADGTAQDSHIADTTTAHGADTANTADAIVRRDSSKNVRAGNYHTSGAVQNSPATHYCYSADGGWIYRKTLALTKVEIVTIAAVIAGLGYTPADIAGDAFTGAIVLPAGSAAAPSIGWTDTGFFERSANALTAVSAGIEVWFMDANQIESLRGAGTPLIRFAAAAVNIPSYSFSGDADTGMWRSAVNELQLTTGGSAGLTIDSSQNIAVAGTVDGRDIAADGIVLDAAAPLASPAFTGTPSLPTGTTGVTQAGADNSTKLATTAYADAAASGGGNTAAAWVNFNGVGTVTIRDDINVSSITDNGVGDFTINFTSALASTSDYALMGTASDNNGGTTPCIVWTKDPVTARTSTAIRIGIRGTSNATYDTTFVQCVIFDQ